MPLPPGKYTVFCALIVALHHSMVLTIIMVGRRKVQASPEALIISSRGTPTKAGGLPLDLCLSYVSHAGVGAIVWWLTEGQAWSPAQVAVWLHRLSKANIELTLGEVRR